jgi:hypothetical protein
MGVHCHPMKTAKLLKEFMDGFSHPVWSKSFVDLLRLFRDFSSERDEFMEVFSLLKYLGFSYHIIPRLIELLGPANLSRVLPTLKSIAQPFRPNDLTYGYGNHESDAFLKLKLLNLYLEPFRCTIPIMN